MDGVAEFDRAVLAHLAPVAKSHRLTFEPVAGRAYAMRGETIAVKIYFPECHGYDLTVCLSPKFNPAWNGKEERGLGWFLEFLGRKEKTPDRIGTIPGAIDGLVCRYAPLLSMVLDRFRTADESLWDDFYRFFDARAEEEKAKRSVKLNLLRRQF